MAERDDARRSADLGDPGGVTHTVPEPTSQADAGRRIGPYRLLKEIGHGGMGTVYLAARADEHYQKRVAVKILRGPDSERVVRRFQRERQILAVLEHPNVARLLDGGATDDGAPYLVMEFVEGQPIDRYCDERRLPIIDRLKLFLGVCAAVQYAHRNLVVHRDIKPGNVFVTAEGTPKLLDFGIAKLLVPELAGETPTATGLAMTPEYASPEQARGGAITTATDVYSLGVLLYELLTGRRPYRFKSREPLDVLRAVCEDEAEVPSAAVHRTLAALPGSPAGETAESVAGVREGTPDRLRRRLRGDLDNIVMMALRKEPQRRYPSVEALSADIQRSIDGRPVAARKPTLAYRVGKFVRRNVLATGAASAAAVLTMAFAVSSNLQARRVALERDRANQQRAKAERVAAFLVDIFNVSDPSESKGKEVTAREILDRGVRKIRVELKDQPELRAALLDSTGYIYAKLGLLQEGRPLLEEALEIRKRVLGEHPDLAASQSHLADLLSFVGRDEEAERLAREALALRRRLLGNESLEVASSLHSLGMVLWAKGDRAAAEPLWRDSLTIRRRLLGNEHTDVAASLSALGMSASFRGDADEAEALFREELDLTRRLEGADSRDVAPALNNLASVLADKGDLDGAVRMLREAVAIWRRTLGDQHPDVAFGLNNLGELLNEAGDPGAAEVALREALAIGGRQGAENRWVASSLEILADVAGAQGKLDLAVALHRDSLAMRRRLSSRSLADSLVGLADALIAKGDYRAAEDAAREAVAIERSGGGSPEDMSSSFAALGRALCHQGRRQAAEAEPMLRDAARLAREAFKRKDHWAVIETESKLGECLVEMGRYDEAERILLRSCEQLRARPGERARATRAVAARVVRLYEASDRPDKAAPYRALSTLRPVQQDRQAGAGR